MTSILRIIVSNEISLARPCSKILESDGVTSSELTIKKMQRIFDRVSINIRSARQTLPAIGDSAGIAKNLDEYQFMACSMVSSMPDSNPYKKYLQKYRIAIIAAFAKLIPIIASTNPEQLSEWNRNAKLLLVDASEVLPKIRSGATSEGSSFSGTTKIGSVLEFFAVPEKEVDEELAALY